jgi:hypothetical protein
MPDYVYAFREAETARRLKKMAYAGGVTPPSPIANAPLDRSIYQGFARTEITASTTAGGNFTCGTGTVVIWKKLVPGGALNVPVFKSDNETPVTVEVKNVLDRSFSPDPDSENPGIDITTADKPLILVRDNWGDFYVIAGGTSDITFHRFELSEKKERVDTTTYGWLLNEAWERINEEETIELLDDLSPPEIVSTRGFYGRGPFAGDPPALPAERGYLGYCVKIGDTYHMLTLEPVAIWGKAFHDDYSAAGATVVSVSIQSGGHAIPPESVDEYQTNVLEEDRIAVGRLALFNDGADSSNTDQWFYVDGARCRRFKYLSQMNLSTDTSFVRHVDKDGNEYGIDRSPDFYVKNVGNKFHGEIGWFGYAAEVRDEWVIISTDSYPMWIVASLATDMSGTTATGTYIAGWEGKKTIASQIVLQDTIGAHPELKTGKKVLAVLRTITTGVVTYEIVEAEGGGGKLYCELIIIDSTLRLRIWFGDPDYDDAETDRKCESAVDLVNDCCFEEEVV